MPNITGRDGTISLNGQPAGNLLSFQLPSAESLSRVHCWTRWLIRRDMPEVLSIEHRSFEFPWSEQDFIDCLRHRNVIGLVAEHAETVLGFMIYELHKSRLDIINFAVHPLCRRFDVGTQLIDKLKSKLNRDRRSRLTLHVRESNLPALLFFRSMGFVAVGISRGHYEEEETTEDAIRMVYRFGWECDCGREIDPKSIKIEAVE